MSDLTISVPDDWADVVKADILEWAKLDILRDAIRESTDNVARLAGCDWRDAVGEPIPRLLLELERLQSLVEAAREVAKEEEVEQVARLTAIVGGK